MFAGANSEFRVSTKRGDRMGSIILAVTVLRRKHHPNPAICCSHHRLWKFG
ncbi:hypothetical protein DsansV1_C22g0173141 [Dioscorea sansibarensis]